MAPHFVLFEHAAGYGLFRVSEFEEVATFLPEVEAAVSDVSKFSQVVNLIGFFPFKTAENALENINAVSEGVVTEDLKLFLETNMPKGGKKGAVLGVSDSKLSASINEGIGIKCTHIGVVPEVIRGIRFHFAKLVKGFTATSSQKAQLGLGHSYSRAKVKFNVNKSDNMIIQSIALLDQMDKDVNTFSMRIREWYSYHFPELIKIVPENALFAKCVKLIKNRKELTTDSLEPLEEIVMDSAKAQAILDASKSSMGMDISPIDLLNIDMFASRVIGLVEYRKELVEYLKSKMSAVAPNLATLIGDTVGARLISHAGSLTNLAKYPASTVQILGAEKALFRALKTRGNTPKYGLIFHSSFIGRAGAKNKGRISRYLANKCSIASRIDCFSENSTKVYGEKLKEQVEDRLKFYETGDLPRKNVDVMQEATEIVLEEVKKKKKKEKKAKKRKLEEDGDTTAADTTAADTTAADTTAADTTAADTTAADTTADTSALAVEAEEEPKKKKKKKSKEVTADTTMDTSAVDTTADTSALEAETEEPPKKKKKKSKDKDLDGTADLSVAADTEETPVKKKKKKKDKEEEITENGLTNGVNGHGDESEEVVLEKKKKKKKKEKADA